MIQIYILIFQFPQNIWFGIFCFMFLIAKLNPIFENIWIFSCNENTFLHVLKLCELLVCAWLVWQQRLRTSNHLNVCKHWQCKHREVANIAMFHSMNRDKGSVGLLDTLTWLTKGRQISNHLNFCLANICLLFVGLTNILIFKTSISWVPMSGDPTLVHLARSPIWVSTPMCVRQSECTCASK